MPLGAELVGARVGFQPVVELGGFLRQARGASNHSLSLVALLCEGYSSCYEGERGRMAHATALLLCAVMNAQSDEPLHSADRCSRAAALANSPALSSSLACSPSRASAYRWTALGCGAERAAPRGARGEAGGVRELEFASKANAGLGELGALRTASGLVRSGSKSGPERWGVAARPSLPTSPAQRVLAFELIMARLIVALACAAGVSAFLAPRAGAGKDRRFWQGR